MVHFGLTVAEDGLLEGLEVLAPLLLKHGNVASADFEVEIRHGVALVVQINQSAPLLLEALMQRTHASKTVDLLDHLSVELSPQVGVALLVGRFGNYSQLVFVLVGVSDLGPLLLQQLVERFDIHLLGIAVGRLCSSVRGLLFCR